MVQLPLVIISIDRKESYELEKSHSLKSVVP